MRRAMWASTLVCMLASGVWSGRIYVLGESLARCSARPATCSEDSAKLVKRLRRRVFTTRACR